MRWRGVEMEVVRRFDHAQDLEDRYLRRRPNPRTKDEAPHSAGVAPRSSSTCSAGTLVWCSFFQSALHHSVGVRCPPGTPPPSFQQRVVRKKRGVVGPIGGSYSRGSSLAFHFRVFCFCLCYVCLCYLSERASSRAAAPSPSSLHPSARLGRPRSLRWDSLHPSFPPSMFPAAREHQLFAALGAFLASSSLLCLL